MAPCNNGQSTFEQVPVTYESYGETNDRNDAPEPVIVILPFFLGSAHAAGHTAIDARTKNRTNVGFRDGLIGPGAAMAGLARQIGAFINQGSPQVVAPEHPAARL